VPAQRLTLDAYLVQPEENKKSRDFGLFLNATITPFSLSLVFSLNIDAKNIIYGKLVTVCLVNGLIFRCRDYLWKN